MYALMPFRMRIFQGLWEVMSKGLAKLFPENTMTDSYKSGQLKKGKIST